MIKNRRIYEGFNRRYLVTRRLNYKKAVRIYEMLWEQAHNLGILPFKNPLQDIEPCLRIARALNWRKSDRKTFSKNS
jgi:hypothetical protein